MKTPKPIRFALTCSLVVSTLSAATAATFSIPNGDVAALKYAIKTANNNNQADTINLAANGKYTLTAADNTAKGANGLPVIGNDTAGLDLTINGNGATIQRSAAPDVAEFRILQIGKGATVRCGRLTIANGRASGSFPDYFGAGIFVSEGTVRLTDCALRKNVGVVGGGVADHLGSLSLQGCTFQSNGAAYGGGLANVQGALALQNSTVSGNVADQRGGGLYNEAGNSTVQCSTFSANSALTAASIDNVEPSGTTAQLAIGNTILSSTGSGTNLHNDDGTIVSKGHNLSNDAADGDATTGPGGLLNAAGDIRNTDPNLGPLKNNGGPTLTHALVGPSAAIDAGDDSVLSAPPSLTTDQRGPGFPRRNGPRVDIGAIESGVSVVVTTLDDHDDSEAIAPSSLSGCTAADCTLREAIGATYVAGGGTVSFAPGLTGTIQLASALPKLSTNLLLQGPGPKLLAVRRSGNANYRIFAISDGTDAGPEVILSGLTISNGRAPAVFKFPFNSGGGILNDRGRVRVRNCILTGNRTAPSSEANAGGAVLNHEGSVTIENSTLTQNSAQYGGGVGSFRRTPGTSSLTIRRSTLSDNTASGGDGGGVYSEANNPNTAAKLFLYSSTLSGNSATPAGISGGAGGAIYHTAFNSGSAVASLLDCTLSDNNAPSAGGIYNQNFSASAVLTLCSTILKTGATGDNFINSNGTITSLGSNLSNDGAGAPGGSEPGGYLNSAGDIRNTDPLLGPLQHNGGRTPTHALLSGSPAINKGLNSPESKVDQRGFLRRGVNDIGAFEFDAILPQISGVTLDAELAQATH